MKFGVQIGFGGSDSLTLVELMMRLSVASRNTNFKSELVIIGLLYHKTV